MFCMQYGKKIMSDMKFCPYCGAKIQIKESYEKQSDAFLYPVQEKSFKFSILSSNQKAVKQINEWLSENYITIKAIKIETILKENSFKPRTILARVVIKYINVSDGSLFKMGYFESVKRIGRDDSKVEIPFADWKRDNSEKEVLWNKTVSYHYQSGTVTTLYYLYSCY